MDHDAPEDARDAPSSGADPLVGVLDEVSEVADGVAADAHELGQEVGHVRRRRLAGSSAREALAGETGPRLVALVDQMLSRLSSASGRLRRVVVGAMLGEGERVTAIARILGVSHQRVSSLRRREPR